MKKLDRPHTRRICTSPMHRGPRWLLAHYFPSVGRVNPDGRARVTDTRCKTCKRLEARARGGHRTREQYRKELKWLTTRS